jgi:hypothetical protein
LYSTYWNRTMREIEAGTYRKDLAKAQRRLAQRGKPLTESEAVTLGIPLTRAKAFVERQNRYLARTDFDSERTVSDGTPLPPAPPPPAPTEPEIPGLSDEDIAALQKKYNEALAGLGSDGGHQAGKKRAPITAAKLKAMLSARVPAILQQQGATRVAFDVATRDGRVVLKAKPIK